jgi:hypothetical protein
MVETGSQAVRHCAGPGRPQDPRGVHAGQHQPLQALVASLDERSRRLVVGFLAGQQGRGGIARLARLTGLSRNTIRRGQQELAQPAPVPPDRIRRPGGGRKRLEKKMSRDPGGPGGPVA